MEKELEAGLCVGLSIEAEDHNIVVGRHLLGEVRFLLLKVDTTVMAAQQLYHSSLQVEFSNFADQSVWEIPNFLKPAIDSKDKQSENERRETVDEGDITEGKC